MIEILTIVMFLLGGEHYGQIRITHADSKLGRVVNMDVCGNLNGFRVGKDNHIICNQQPYQKETP
jgi:hypothetical protein